MNRGHNGEPILAKDGHKRAFLDLLAEKVPKYHMRLFAYCLMDNHYHLVMQNPSGRMSDFFRNLNTHYASGYRKSTGGKGYVFQSRFHSTIIEDDSYLKMAIIYVLQNPLRAGLVDHYDDYCWSSGGQYSQKKKLAWLDAEYVLELFGGRKGLADAMKSDQRESLPLLYTSFGPVLGEDAFLSRALAEFDRRKKPDAVKKRRRDDYDFDPVEKVIWEFTRTFGGKMDEINTGRIDGKRLRGELLVRLRDLAGLNFKQISEMEPFSGLKYMSLSHLYWEAKKRRLSKS